MTRLVVALTTSVCFFTPAFATFSPPTEPLPFGKSLPPGLAKELVHHAQQEVLNSGQKEEFRITDQTEILLNGQACKYQDVPGTAGIINMELAADKKTILKIHFQTRR